MTQAAAISQNDRNDDNVVTMTMCGNEVGVSGKLSGGKAF
jgi:hypothetical protein